MVCILEGIQSQTDCRCITSLHVLAISLSLLYLQALADPASSLFYPIYTNKCIFWTKITLSLSLTMLNKDGVLVGCFPSLQKVSKYFPTFLFFSSL